MVHLSLCSRGHFTSAWGSRGHPSEGSLLPVRVVTNTPLATAWGVLGERDHPSGEQGASHPINPPYCTMAWPAALQPVPVLLWEQAGDKASLPRDTWKSCSVFPSRPVGRLQMWIKIQFVKKPRIKYGVKMDNMLDDMAYECQLCLRVFTDRLQPAILIGSQSRKWKCFTNQDEWYDICPPDWWWLFVEMNKQQS